VSVLIVLIFSVGFTLSFPAENINIRVIGDLAEKLDLTRSALTVALTDGILLPHFKQKGINIIRHKDGTARKVLVK
jgi:hypothetical protein